MREFSVSKQDALIKALMNHPDNFDRSPQFALGYLTMMLYRNTRSMTKMQKDIFMAEVNDIIDRSRKAREDHLAAG